MLWNHVAEEEIRDQDQKFQDRLIQAVKLDLIYSLGMILRLYSSVAMTSLMILNDQESSSNLAYIAHEFERLADTYCIYHVP